MLNQLFRASIIFTLFLFFVQLAGAQTPQPEYTRERTIDLQHYIIRLSFDRNKKTIFGDTTVQLKPLTNNFNTIELDAANLKFESVILESENKQLSFKTSGEKVFVSLDKMYSPEDLISLRFKYSSIKPKKRRLFCRHGN